MISQLFGLSFWRHPSTAGDPLVSKRCKRTHLHFGWPEIEYISSYFLICGWICDFDVTPIYHQYISSICKCFAVYVNFCMTVFGYPTGSCRSVTGPGPIPGAPNKMRNRFSTRNSTWKMKVRKIWWRMTDRTGNKCICMLGTKRSIAGIEFIYFYIFHFHFHRQWKSYCNPLHLLPLSKKNKNQSVPWYNSS